MIILRQREFGNKANKEAQREWKISQAFKDKEIQNSLGNGEGYEYLKSSEIGKMREEAKKTGKMMWETGRNTGQSEFINNWNDHSKNPYKEEHISYDPKYTRMTSEEYALKQYRSKNKKITDPLEKKQVASRSIRTDHGNGDYSVGTFEKPVKPEEVKKYGGVRELDHQMKEKLKDPKVKTKIAKQKFNRTLNNAKKDISGFVKDNKKGLAIGGAALGTAALVGGGIALHRRNKKKKEEENKKEI